MTRARMAAVLGALVLLAAVVLRQVAPGASARPADVARTAVAPASVPGSAVPIAPPARDIFSYGGDDDGEPAVSMTRRIDAPTPLPAPPSLADPAAAPTPGGPRLVGIVRRAGGLKAAVSLDGEMFVLGAGEHGGGYTVLHIDEEDGVRLRDQAGTTITLSPPPQ